MFRAGAGKDIDRHHFQRKLRIVQPVEIGAGQHAVRVCQPDLCGDGGGGAGMVAGDHLHPDARRPAFGHGGNGLGARRVDQADEAKEDRDRPPACLASIRSARLGPFGQRQHAQAPPRQRLGPVVPVMQVDAGAHPQHPFRRALHMVTRPPAALQSGRP